MFRWSFSLVLLLALAPSAMAHFLFVVPQANGSKAKIIFSESLEPDDGVDVKPLAGAALSVRAVNAAKEERLSLVESEHAYDAVLPGGGTRIVRGSFVYGVQQRGTSPTFLLKYHPKTIVGDPFDGRTVLGDAALVEIIARGAPGAVRFQVLARGKPLAGAEVTVIPPAGREEKAVTNKEGLTRAFDLPGRYGTWTRYFEDTPGEHSGTKYEQVRHYPTLVVDVPDATIAPPPASAENATPVANRYATLPEATSSFGAVASDGYLYVYGGHVARTHTYHTRAVSGRFHRLKLSPGAAWEELPGGPGLQGMNLAAHKGKVYRVGGMEPRNKQGEKADNYSIADCARFDPATMRWESLPPLPEPRSSHDVVVVGDKLLVIGGWNMKGHAGGNDWLDTMLALDLDADTLAWKSLKQPFERRALIAAVRGNSVFVVGGFNEDSEPLLDVEIYDVAAEKWTSGPKLPGGDRNGFAPAACAHGGSVYASVADGSLFRLGASGDHWEKVATATPRIVHRLVPDGAQILICGGAAKGDNLDLVEAVTVAGSSEASVR